jgi:flagellar hook-associated protein 2
MKITALDGSSVSIIDDGVNALDFEDASYILKAQNMNANVDGIEYDVSSNTIVIQGNLTVTAIETGTSTISLQKDTTSILPALEAFVEKYNELVTLVDDELYSSDSSLEDPGSIRAMMNNIKNSLFGTYGLDNDKNIYAYGFGLDSSGHLSIDDAIFSKAVTDDLDGLKTLFVGVAEKEGLGTQLKSFLDALDGTDGILAAYGDNMIERKENLDEDKEKAQETLDSKYRLMGLQFASYTAIISQLEASFGGLKLMIESSTS